MHRVHGGVQLTKSELVQILLESYLVQARLKWRRRPIASLGHTDLGIKSLLPGKVLRLIVDELTFLAIATLSRSVLVEVFADLGLVVFVVARLLLHQLLLSVGIGALFVELTLAFLHPVAAEFGLVVDSEVLNVSYHLLFGGEVDLLLGLQLRGVKRNLF